MFISVTSSTGHRQILALDKIVSIREQSGSVGCFVTILGSRDAIRVRDSFDDLAARAESAAPGRPADAV